MRDSICVLSGGTGTPKLLQGLIGLVEPARLKIIVNTADDVMVGDVYICPDVDTVLYTLAGMIDQEKWYGIQGDTYSVYEERCRKGIKDLLRVGDMDRSNAEFRTSLLRSGSTLSDAISEQRCKLGIRQEVWPMTDSKVTTKIKTPQGIKDFQEYWVRDGGMDEVRGVEFEGLRDAVVSEGAAAALASAKLVIIGPSNPITSIGPIVETPGVKSLLIGSQVVAISPIRAGAPFSGPAGKMLKGLGYKVSPATIAHLYGEFLSDLIIDHSDAQLANELSETFGIRVHVTNIDMRKPEEKLKLARAALAACREGETNGR